MQLVAVDIGNQSSRVAIAESSDDPRWSIYKIWRRDEPIELDENDIDSEACWVVSSVNGHRLNSLRQWVEEFRASDVFHVIGSADIPLQSNVESRECVGKDRLVAAYAASQLAGPGNAVIVVDAGTAVTIDCVDRSGVFQGGVIFPGSESCFETLCRNTDALPDLAAINREKGHAEFEIGRSTTEAIINGVNQSQLHAITGIVSRIQSLSPAEVYATGGGIEILLPSLPATWNIVPDLVLSGARMIGKLILSERGD